MEDLVSSVGSNFLDLLTVANGVQGAVENGRWAYLAVISVFVLVEFYKRKNPNIKKKAAHISAGLGSATGAIMASSMGSDPVSGAIGGFMVGNAASGLSSFLKPITAFTIGEYLSIIKLALSVASHVSKRIDKNNRKKALKEFDEAIGKTKGENPSTKDLEQWFSKHI